MKRKYLTVSALTKYIKKKIDIDPHLNQVFLKGEISNFKLHVSGHMYFTIKDQHSRIQAVMFQGQNKKLRFKPENGMNVLIRGEVSVFESYGQYQLYVYEMEPDGIGALYLAYEQLKEKLASEGIFDEAVKLSIPKFPKHIGLITSPTGAAVRDMVTTIRRRFPMVEVTVIPTLVQGPSAAMEIKRAIERANHLNSFDVLIVGRGGGSIEELWSFNEEIVVKAIYYSKIPIISAVGHETDITLSDYAADKRAPTPTGAAELAVPSYEELLNTIHLRKQSMTRSVQTKIKHHQKHLNTINKSYAFRFPSHLLKEKELELDQFTERINKSLHVIYRQRSDLYMYTTKRLHQKHPEKKLEESLSKLEQLQKRLNTIMSQTYKENSRRAKTAVEKLLLLNPLEVMKRGFAIPYTEDGELIQSKNQVGVNDIIKIHLSDGELESKVLTIREKKHDQ